MRFDRYYVDPHCIRPTQGLEGESFGLERRDAKTEILKRDIRHEPRNLDGLQLAIERKPRDVGTQANLARAYLYADRWPEAITQARIAYALSPSHLAARYWLLQILALSGAHAEAIEIGENFLSNMPNESLFLGLLGIACAKAGRETDARAALKLMQDAPVSQHRNTYLQAQVLAQLGDVDAGFAWQC